MARDAGFAPAAKGEPASGVSAPEETSIEYAATFPEPEFAEYRKSPEGSTTSATGLDLSLNGEPGTDARLPEESITNAEMELSLELATYTNFPRGSTTTEAGRLPTS